MGVPRTWRRPYRRALGKCPLTPGLQSSLRCPFAAPCCSLPCCAVFAMSVCFDCAVLCCAVLCCAVLCCAVLCCCALCCAVLCCPVLRCNAAPLWLCITCMPAAHSQTVQFVVAVRPIAGTSRAFKNASALHPDKVHAVTLLRRHALALYELHSVP